VAERITWVAFDNSSSLDKQFTCGYCGTHTATAQSFGRVNAYRQIDQTVEIRICMNCGAPTYFGDDGQMPAPRAGRAIEHLPPVVESAYKEARASFAAGAPTAAALMCRKILMNVAVTKGAPPNRRFVEYVDYLTGNHYVPPGSETWVAHIKDGGNGATHEIEATDSTDAAELVQFTESLLTYVFELPGRMQAKSPKPRKSGK
jgi:hypothetical protein